MSQSSLWTSPDMTKRLSLGGLGVLLLFALWQAMKLWGFSLDDAYISLTYAKNLAAGKGMVFFPGDRVEGYSNPLWVILLAVGGKLGLPMVGWAKTLGFLSMMGTLFLVWRLTFLWIEEKPAESNLSTEPKRRKGKNSTEASDSGDELTAPQGAARVWIPVLVAGWWLVNPGVLYYSVAGLETILLTFLLTLSIFLHIRDKGETAFAWYAIPLGFAALTRPEAIAFLVGLVGWRLLGKVQEVEGKSFGEKLKALPRREWISVSVALTPFVLWMVLRLSYYGALFPNTYYAKPSTFWKQPGLGVSYVLGFFQHYASSVIAKGPKASGLYSISWLLGWLTALLLAFLLVRGLLQKAYWKQTLPLLVVLFLGFLFAFYTGGDWMTHHRFLQPVLPLLALLVGVGLWSMPVAKQRIWLIALGVLLLWQTPRVPMFSSALAGNSQLDHAHRSDNNIKMAKWLKKNVPAGKSILTDEIGAIGYFSGLRVLDFWGLVDKKVASLLHKEKFNPYSTPPYSAKRARVQGLIAKELLKRKPDYILLDYQGPVPANTAALDKRRIHPITMKQLFSQMGTSYSYVRGFSLMKKPFKTFVLYKRD